MQNIWVQGFSSASINTRQGYADLFYSLFINFTSHFYKSNKLLVYLPVAENKIVGFHYFISSHKHPENMTLRNFDNFRLLQTINYLFYKELHIFYDLSFHIKNSASLISIKRNVYEEIKCM